MLKRRKTQKGKKRLKSIAKLKKDLWRVFAKFIKKRDKGICFTCGKKASGASYHAGHFIKKSISGIELYFNEDNVHGQCFYCNMFLDGAQYIYGTKLGAKKVAELYKIKEDTRGKVWDRATFNKKIAYYKAKIK